MGFEYKVKVPDSVNPNFDELLRDLPGFSGIEPEFSGYHFRAKGNVGKMPNVEARIGASTLYVCDYGGGSTFLSNIVMACLVEFNEVTVSKLEWQ